MANRRARGGVDPSQVARHFLFALAAGVAGAAASIALSLAVDLADVYKRQVERHGEEPRIVGCADTAEVLARTLEAVRAFRASGRKTLGILHASDELAARYAELLSRDVDVHLLTERTD